MIEKMPEPAAEQEADEQISSELSAPMTTFDLVPFPEASWGGTPESWLLRAHCAGVDRILANVPYRSYATWLVEALTEASELRQREP